VSGGVLDSCEVLGTQRSALDELAQVRFEGVQLLNADLCTPALAHVVE
jgi:hypothetical protein